MSEEHNDDTKSKNNQKNQLSGSDEKKISGKETRTRTGEA